MREIIVHTDASFAEREEKAAWAYWIESPDGDLRDVGMLEGRVENSSTAELFALCRAFDRIAADYGDEKFHVKIFCDSLWVIFGIRGTPRTYPGITAKHMAMLSAVVEDLRYHKLTADHVKGHARHLKSAKQIANNWCDFAAREALRKELRKT